MIILSSSVLRIKPDSASLGLQPNKIIGKTTKNGLATQSIVRCYDKASGALLLQGVSDKDGVYSFSGLNKNNRYYIVSHDPLSKFNAVIQDNVVPK